MKKIAIFSVTFIMLTACSRQKSSAVQIYEKPIVIPTYQIGEPEKNPMFYVPANYQGAQHRIYPYPLLDNLTDNKTGKTYRALFLENKYLQICVLPELGGRLYFARDKTNDYNFIYHNHVIKPALIGMAGAWISGGVEWNIPHHHRVSTFMPVDYRLMENSDGSKTIWVGEYEKRHGSKWNVGLTLYPDRSFIRTDINLFNVTPLDQSFLIWANLAVHANADYQVIFPPDVSQVVFHSKVAFTSWPVARNVYMGIDFTRGVDVSWWKNAPSPISYFAWGSHMDFLGGIDHGKQAGTLMVGEHHTVPGKKFWNWGDNEVSRLWDQQMLTDSDGSYLELMMGAFSDNQPDYSWNDPYHSKHATMYFSPIRNLSGIKNANRDFAVNVTCAEEKAKVEIYASGTFDDLKFVLSDSGSFRYEKAFSITPGDPIAAEVQLQPGVQDGTLRLAVLDDTGNELLIYKAAPAKDQPFPDTYKPPRDPAVYPMVEQLYLTGLRLEQFHNPDYDPLVYYREALKREPDNIEVNTRLGIHALRHYDDAAAEQYLRSAVQVVSSNYTSPRDGEPLYYLGDCLFEQEREAEAYDILYKASWSHAWASPAFYLIACLDGRRGDWPQALAHTGQAIEEDRNNLEAVNLKCMILRRLQRYDEARAAADQALREDPLNFIALYERYRLSGHFNETGRTADLRSALIQVLRGEPDNYLACASRYARAGLFADAIDLLQMGLSAGNKTLASDPLLYYYLGNYYKELNDSLSCRENLQKAAMLPIDYCFPYGRESARVLKTAVQENASDANAWYYLGNLYYDHRPQQAIECWQKAIALDDQTALFYRNLAFARANYLDDLPAAIKLMHSAMALAADDPLYLSELDLYLSACNTPVTDRMKIFRDHAQTVQKSDEATARMIVLMTALGKYDEAIGMLKERHFHSAERFDVNLHRTWVDAHILRGIQSLNAGRPESALADFNAVLEFPRNLEIARDSKSELAYYFIGQCYKQIGEPDRAIEFFNKSVEKRATGGWAGGEWPQVLYSKALAYRELGRNAEAEGLFMNMIDEGRRALTARPHPARYTNSAASRFNLNSNKARACLRIALGYLGQGNKSQTAYYIHKAQEFDTAIGYTLIFK